MYLSETMKWKRSTSAKQPAGLSETEEYVYWFEHLLSSGDDDQVGKLKAFKQKIMSMPEEMRDPILVSGPDNPSSPPGPGTPMFLTIPRDLDPCLRYALHRTGRKQEKDTDFARFLKARQWEEDKALDMYINTVR